MFIHLPGNIAVSVSAAEFRAVTCHHCHCRYLYKLSRRVTTHNATYGDDPKPFVASTQRRARRALKNAVDPVPCPNCGHLQPAMIRTLKTERLALLFLISLPVIFIIAMLALAAGVPEWNFSPAIPITLALLSLITFLALAFTTLVKDHNARPLTLARLNNSNPRTLRAADFPDLARELFAPLTPTTTATITER